MTRRPPCAPACPFIIACQECDWQSLWRCQVCQGPAHEGEVICTECAGQPTSRLNDKEVTL